VAPSLLGLTGVVYAAFSVVLGLLFVLSAWKVMTAPDGDDRPAKRMFGYSILYLFLLFALMIVDRAPGLIPLGLAPLGAGG
jgi:protoheme IX farnesyltransferase